MKTIEEKRALFEQLWKQANGHFRYFKFSNKENGYIPTGIRDDLSDNDLMLASITVNTAYLFYLGAWKHSESMRV